MIGGRRFCICQTSYRCKISPGKPIFCMDLARYKHAEKFMQLLAFANLFSNICIMDDPKIFDIDLNGQAAQVSAHTIKSAKVFHIVFTSRRPALNITIAENADGVKFWTSVPEGRQEEAELAGKAIASYIRTYRRNQLCVTTTDKKLPAPNLFD